MLLTVVSVFYNRAEMVEASVNSILNQSLSCDCYEVLLIDDGSTDSTYDELNKFSHHLNVRVISHNNSGFVSSMNLAIQQAHGQYIAVHGSGDISHKDRFLLQSKYLLNNPNMIAVGCKVIASDLTNNRNWKIYVKPHYKHGLNKKLFKKNVYTHGEVMFDRKSFLLVDGYRDIFRFSQDYDLWFRLAEIGILGNFNEALYTRFVTQSGVSGSLEKRLIQSRLGELARKTAIIKRRTGVDIVEQYGIDAPLLLLSSNRLRKVDTKRLINALLRSDQTSLHVLFSQASITPNFFLRILFKVVLLLRQRS